MMLVLIQRVYIYALWLIVTCGLLLVTVNSDLVCPDGWHKHNTQCYWFSDFNTTRATAMSECVSRNGSLVTVSNSNVNTFLETHLLYDTKYWIGVKLVNLQPYAWRWTNGSSIYSLHGFDWCDDVVTPSTACGGVFYTSIRYNCLTDVRCAQDTHQFICEKEWSSDNDCPRTNLGSGTKVWYIENKYCYYVAINDSKNSADAARICWQNGARLFTIKHEKDSEFLTDLAPGKGTIFWVGISPYRWDDRTAYTWHNWDNTGPSIGGHCTLLQGDGTWRYGVCTDSNNFICQTGVINATSTTTTITTTIAATLANVSGTKTREETSSPETTSGKASVSAISHTSPVTTVQTTYSTRTNGNAKTQMLLEPTSTSDGNELVMYVLIGIFSAVGVVSVVFIGLLAKCLVLRKQHISRMKNMSMEQETSIAEVTSFELEGGAEYIYDSPEIVKQDDVDETEISRTLDNADRTEIQINYITGSQNLNSDGQEAIAQTALSSTEGATSTSDEVGPQHSNNNDEQTQSAVKNTDTSADAMAHTSISPRHVLINGEVYAEVDMSRKTIGYDDVILPQNATNNDCETIPSEHILSPTCNQEAIEQPDIEDTSESIYYNESAQPIYSNEDSDHDLKDQTDSAPPSDTCDADHYINGEDTYANSEADTGGVTYTEVDVPESKAEMPTEEEMCVYSDIKM